MKTPPLDVDTYIASFPEDTQVLLKTIRRIILENAPESEESISYGMPAYKMKGKPLVYFAGYKKHIGLYATPSGHSAFKEELSNYKQGKGSVQFPSTEELPHALIAKIVQFKVQLVSQR
jgi:uncharacterized protein YdhG (YjbR/CyaY superfamily)